MCLSWLLDSIKFVIILPFLIFSYVLISVIGGYLVKAGILAHTQGNPYASYFSLGSFYIPEETFWFGFFSIAALLAILIAIVLVLKFIFYCCKSGGEKAKINAVYYALNNRAMEGERMFKAV